jgi:hypothetical protein
MSNLYNFSFLSNYLIYIVSKLTDTKEDTQKHTEMLLYLIDVSLKGKKLSQVEAMALVTAVLACTKEIHKLIIPAKLKEMETNSDSVNVTSIYQSILKDPAMKQSELFTLRRRDLDMKMSDVYLQARHTHEEMQQELANLRVQIDTVKAKILRGKKPSTTYINQQFSAIQVKELASEEGIFTKKGTKKAEEMTILKSALGEDYFSDTLRKWDIERFEREYAILSFLSDVRVGEAFSRTTSDSRASIDNSFTVPQKYIGRFDGVISKIWMSDDKLTVHILIIGLNRLLTTTRTGKLKRSVQYIARYELVFDLAYDAKSRFNFEYNVPMDRLGHGKWGEYIDDARLQIKMEREYKFMIETYRSSNINAGLNAFLRVAALTHAGKRHGALRGLENAALFDKSVLFEIKKLGTVSTTDDDFNDKWFV